MARTSIRDLRWALSSLVMVMLVLPERRATADEVQDLAESNVQFEAGKRALVEGDVARACEHFAESYRLAPRGGNLLNLGVCHERAQRLVLARRELTEALTLANRDGRADREALIREHLARVDAGLCWVRFVLPDDVASDAVTVEIDGVRYAGGLDGLTPVDPGEHVIRARAKGHRDQELRIVARRGSTQELKIAPFVVEHALSVRNEPPTAPVLRPREVSPAARWRLPRMIVLLASSAAIVVGGVTGGFAIRQKRLVEARCDAHLCDTESGMDAARKGHALALASTVTLVVGGVGMGTWAALPGGLLRPGERQSREIGLVASGRF